MMPEQVQVDSEYLRLVEAVVRESRAVEIGFNEFMFGDVEELNLTDLVIAIADLDEYLEETKLQVIPIQ